MPGPCPAADGSSVLHSGYGQIFCQTKRPKFAGTCNSPTRCQDVKLPPRVGRSSHKEATHRNSSAVKVLKVDGSIVLMSGLLRNMDAWTQLNALLSKLVKAEHLLETLAWQDLGDMSAFLSPVVTSSA